MKFCIFFLLLFINYNILNAQEFSNDSCMIMPLLPLPDVPSESCEAFFYERIIPYALFACVLNSGEDCYIDETFSKWENKDGVCYMQIKACPVENKGDIYEI